jgi:hypothetical protein
VSEVFDLPVPVALLRRVPGRNRDQKSPFRRLKLREKNPEKAQNNSGDVFFRDFGVPDQQSSAADDGGDLKNSRRSRHSTTQLRAGGLENGYDEA